MNLKNVLLVGAIVAASFVPTMSSADAQAVVTEVEPAGAVELRAAMQRIARNPLDPVALADAGAASLLLGDPAAAQSFYRRALAQSPRSGPATAGLASALLRSENPFDALKLFDQALKLGMPESSIAADRGLAFDLIGNFALAQRDYQIAGIGPGHGDTLLRMAVSLGLSGRVSDSDRLLTPMLRDNQVAAWRVRAFLLAAQGKPDDALQIARGFLPAAQAEQLVPFFRKMADLTPAQKVAAIHFGNFPASAAIGRDSQAVRVAVAGTDAAAAAGGAGRLVPAGTPLGSTASAQRGVATERPGKAELRRLERAAELARRKQARSGGKDKRPSSGATAEAVMPVPPSPVGSIRAAVPTNGAVVSQTGPGSAQLAAERSRQAVDGLAGRVGEVQAVRAAALPLPTPVQKYVDRTGGSGSAQPVTAAPASANVALASPAVAMAPAAAVSSASNTASPGPLPAPSVSGVAPAADRGAAMADGSAITAPLLTAAGPISSAHGSSDGMGTIPPTIAAAPATVAASDPAPSFTSLPNAASQVRPGGLGEIVAAIEIPEEEKVRDFVPVDLAKIAPKAPKAPNRPVAPAVRPEKKIAALAIDTKADAKKNAKASAKGDARESAKGKDPKAVEVKQPARYWVQIATGSSISGLQFDWRKLVKANASLLAKQEAWTSPWGRTRRMVVGPFKDQKAAKTFEVAFRKAGGDGFVWQSADGTLVEKLGGN